MPGDEIIQQITLKLDEISKKVDNTCTQIEMNKFYDEFKVMNTRIIELEKFAEYQGSKLSQLEPKVEILEKDLVEKNRVIDQLQQSIYNLESRNDDQENQSRKNMLEIDGIPKQKDEHEDRSFCKKIAIKLHSVLTADDNKQQQQQQQEQEGEQDTVEIKTNETAIHHGIDIAHRIKSGAILVLFESRQKREEFYQARFQLKSKTVTDLGLTKPKGVKGTIWVNESLTNGRKAILKRFKDKLKASGIGIGKDGVKVYTTLGQIRVKYDNYITKIFSDYDANQYILHMQGKQTR